MGTNFYVPAELCENPCKHCTAPTGLHIGKRSAGWRFGFHSYPTLGLTSWKAWRNHIDKVGYVTDESGQSHTPDEFREIVMATLKPYGIFGLAPVNDDNWEDERRTFDEEGWRFWEGDFS